MTTDEDIIAALQGRPTAAQQRSTEAIRSALNGTSDARERAHADAVVEALQGGSGEAIALWSATEAAAAATKALAEAIMRSDGSVGIYAAEAEARGIAEEAYTEAAKRIPHEAQRQEAVARIATKIAASFTRRLSESTPKPKAAETQQQKVQAPAGTPGQKRESRSLMTPKTTIISYS